MIVLMYWVKFEDRSPEKWVSKNFEEFWNRIREHMMQYSLKLEWIICE